MFQKCVIHNEDRGPYFDPFLLLPDPNFFRQTNVNKAKMTWRFSTQNLAAKCPETLKAPAVRYFRGKPK
jgi:hypothetical protein